MDDRLQSEEALSYELIRYSRLHHVLKAKLGSVFPNGLDHAAVGVLMTLIKRGALRQGELADLALLDPSTVSRHVGQLVRAGLVERRPDPGDGRAVQLVATRSGHALGADLADRRRSMFHETLASWAQDDVRQLAGLLGRLNDDFESQRPHLLCTDPALTAVSDRTTTSPIDHPIDQEN